MSILRIELLKDCEMNSGRVVNSLFSDDVFFDGFGLPFIPAWIIRNSLVKAIEDNHVPLSEEEYEALVGRHAHLVIDDAIVAGRESMRQAIVSSPYGEMLLRNPQSVLNASGFVKMKRVPGLNDSLYVRMFAKDTIFEASVEIEDCYLDAFARVVESVEGLFVGYNVPARFTFDAEWKKPSFNIATPTTSWDGERVRLEYKLHAISHKTTLNHISGELEAQPYITGGEIRDALKVRSELEELLGNEESGVRFSFAYIEVNGRRGLPIPASFSTKKQDKNDLRDRCSRGRRPKDYDQIKGVGDLFIDDPDTVEIHAMGVRKEQAIAQIYHDGAFEYTSFGAIGPAQTFRGFIEGPREEVRRIYESLQADGFMRIGHFFSLGFGSAFIEMLSVEPLKPSEPVLVEEITVLLASPARLYRNGLYEASAQNVLEEIQSRLDGAPELEIVTNSQKTCPISIYNTSWGEFEPLEYAMQAGSIYRVRAKDRSTFDIAALADGIFIGGHNDAGYGETWVMPAVDAYYRHISYDDQSVEKFSIAFKVNPIPGRKLMRALFQSNANAAAAHMGSMLADSFVSHEFVEGPLRSIQGMIRDDFDTELVFEAYMDALKEAGLNVIRRGTRD